MAIKYVSQTATNGYAVGIDSNDGSTKALAKLTLEAAITVASANDTIIVNDGVYTSATYFNITKNLTINPENPGAVTLKRTGVQTEVVYMRVSGCALTLGALIIDAEGNANTNCVGTDVSGNRSLTLNGTILRNPGTAKAGFATYGIASSLNLTVNSSSFSSLLSSSGMYIQLHAGAIKINGFYAYNADGVGAASALLCPVYLDARTAGVVMSIKGVSGTWKTQSGASTVSFIKALGMRGIISECRGMEINGLAAAAALIRCDNSNGIQANTIVIRRNQGVQKCAGGYLIFVGAESVDANVNKTNYPMIYNNDVTGTDAASSLHGIMIGASTGGAIFGNVIRNAAIPIVSKLSSNIMIMDNDIIDPTSSQSGCIRSKGTSELHVAGNRIRMSAGHINPIAVDQDPTGPTLSTGATFIGNVLYSPVEMTTAAVVGTGSDASSATFLLNDYIAPTFGASAFRYGGTTYATPALWGAAREATYFNSTDATTSDGKFWKDSYEPMKDAALAATYPHLLPIF